ncbi:MAG: heme-copper oxidase subunit III [Myxococcota bacterium]
MASETDLRLVHPPPQPVERRVPSAVLGTLIFIMTEIMLFGGFIAAFLVARSAVEVWPPPDQPLLPVEETAFNTVALLLSGAIVYYAGRRFTEDPSKAKLPMLIGMLLGVFFVVFQGVEWVQLLSDGLTLQKSAHASFFYLIVGAHGLHVIGGTLVLFNLWLRLQTNKLTAEAFWAGRLFWYFVVLLWPFLYYLVYLR